MSLRKAFQVYLGWCPMRDLMRPALTVQPRTAAAPGGQDGVTPELGWWNRYHNQLLAAALIASVAAAVASLPVKDAPWYSAIFLGVGLGVGLALGFLLSHRKQYARIDAGEFIRATMSRRLRITRDLSLPVAIILFAGVMAYCVLEDRLDQIFALMLALGIAFWAQYGFTLLWERRHRKTLIAEKGSMYTLDTAPGDGRVC